ncbi:hypothetical protein FQA39_LY06381 [Lamprigera yunnana]|nr:hypothetical protein FQA39_LY06381 [Lamprigera yunnana]
MGDNLLQKHYLQIEQILRLGKLYYENKLKPQFKSNVSLTDFTIVRTLGTGSFGRVLLVHDKNHNNEVYAVKVIEKAHIVKTRQVQHTIAEIKTLTSVRFEFLVFMEYFFKDNVYLFLVLPFINGGEMFNHLRNMRKFDETLAKFYAAQVILAFEYLHFLGLVYRDLKPENILIDKDGYIKITDFGFAKKIDDQRTYTLCGTPEYLAPEIILSQGYNKSVDWWSLGVLIFEMNAGYSPFYAKDPMRIYEKIVAGKYFVPLHFSTSLSDLVFNILQVDRTKRYGVLKNGVKDIKEHQWFKSLNWDAVLAREIIPTSKPNIKSADDASNFDYYEEQPLKTSDKDLYLAEFAVLNVT